MPKQVVLKLIEELLMIFDSVAILSATEFSFAGTHISSILPSGWQVQNPCLSHSLLLARLQLTLYENCYCRRFKGALHEAIEQVFEHDNIAAELSIANNSRDGRDVDWEILNVEPSGEIIARRQQITRMFYPGQFLSRDGPGAAPRVGARVDLFLPRESQTRQQGFYFAFGEAISDQPEDYNLVRFYWNVEINGIALLVRSITERLNRFQVPFQLKCLALRSQFPRLDAAVLYISQKYYPVAALLLAEIYCRVKHYLGDESPLFTKQLAPGFSLAEDPKGGGSFGANRCRILAEAIWSAHTRGLNTAEEKFQESLTLFNYYGLDLSSPYLNAKSVDRYEFSEDWGKGSSDGLNLSQNRFMEAALAIGYRLCRETIWADRRCNWLGPSLELVGKKREVVQRTFGPDVYGGISGIAFFLAQLYRATGEKMFLLTAEGGMRQALSALGDIDRQQRLGFYSGLSGIAFVLIQAGEAFENQDWVARGAALLEDCGNEVLNQQSLDVSTGIAGAIPVLLSHYLRCRKNIFIETAIRFGEFLIDAANKSAIGWSWSGAKNSNAPLSNSKDLTGLSHGAAGIALALLELYYETYDQRFLDAARSGFNYEAHWFNPRRENWPDFRQQKVGDGVENLAYETAWCHGAPGIGLTRLRAYELTGEVKYRSEAEAAIRTTIASLQSVSFAKESYSLCHGATGNSDLLIYASQVLGYSSFKSIADEVGIRGFEEYSHRTTVRGCAMSDSAPGLMLGLAGIGYFYLRLSDPLNYPSILIALSGKSKSRN